MTTCNGCGTHNPSGSRFCGDCGQSIDAPSTCAACGSIVRAGLRFCTGCGARLLTETGQSSSQSALASVAPADPGLAPVSVTPPPITMSEPTDDRRSSTIRHLADVVSTSAPAPSAEHNGRATLTAQRPIAAQSPPRAEPDRRAADEPETITLATSVGHAPRVAGPRRAPTDDQVEVATILAGLNDAVVPVRPIPVTTRRPRRRAAVAVAALAAAAALAVQSGALALLSTGGI